MIDQSLHDKLFKCYPILKKIQPEHLKDALKHAVIHRYKAGQQMWVETEKIQGFPFVLKGMGRVYKLAPNGRELHLYSVGPGDPCVLATGSIVGDSNVNARAICEEDYEMIAFPNPVFKTLVAESEVFRDYVLGDLTEHLSQLTEMAAAIVFQNLDQRLAASLIAKKTPIQITHQVLADELGSVREIISRILKNFADRGWIELGRGQISVISPQNLKEFANQQ